jgi:hypothetical protein
MMQHGARVLELVLAAARCSAVPCWLKLSPFQQRGVSLAFLNIALICKLTAVADCSS